LIEDMQEQVEKGKFVSFFSELCKLDDEYSRMTGIGGHPLAYMADDWNLLSVERIDPAIKTGYTNEMGKILSTCGIASDEKLARLISKESALTVLSDLADPFIPTVLYDEKNEFHDFLMARGLSESHSYGVLPLWVWVKFFIHHRMNGDKLLEYLVGLTTLSKTMFKQSGKSNERIEITGCTYNIQNICECIINGLEIKSSLILTVLEVKTKDSILGVSSEKKVNLRRFIDDMTLWIAVNPKRMIKKLRLYLTFAVRYSGVRCFEQRVWKPTNTNEGTDFSKMRFEDVDVSSGFKWIANSKTFNDQIAKLKELRNSEIERIGYFPDYFLEIFDICLSVDMRNTKPEHAFALFSLLLNLQRIAGYGRGLSYATSARSAPEKKENLTFTKMLSKTVSDVWDRAVLNRYYPLTDEEFVPACIGFLKSTQSGIDSVEVKVGVTTYDSVGKMKKYFTESFKTSKKIVVGLMGGADLFNPKNMKKIDGIEAVGKVGYRDVPYKATRAIYVVPLPVLYYQVLVASHMQRYLNMCNDRLENQNYQVTSETFSIGSKETSGIQIFDNVNTILLSSDLHRLAVDADMSEFDSHNVQHNFRRPILSTMLRKFEDHMSSSGIKDEFGPSKVSIRQAFELGFGSGRILNTCWDNGRKPTLVKINEDMEVNKEVKTATKSKFKLKIEPGWVPLKEGQRYQEVSDDEMNLKLSESKGIKVRADLSGSDLILLTSEASGEYPTLIFNSTESMAIVEYLKEKVFAPLGLEVVKVQVVGDDLEITIRVGKLYEVISYDDFLKLMVDAVAECGHMMSIFKTMICPLHSEYRQIYCAFGLKIEKNHLMKTSSERPRRVEVQQYLTSRKRFYITCILRGDHPGMAMAMYLLEAFYLWRTPLKFATDITEIPITDKRQVYYHMPKTSITKEGILKCGSVSITRDYKIKPDYKVERTKNVIWIRKSLLWATLPIECGGLGLSSLNMCIHHTGAYFMRRVAESENDSSTKILNFTIAAMCINSAFEKSGGVDIRVETPKTTEDLINKHVFSEVTKRNINELRMMGFDRIWNIGRYKAENTASRLLEDSLSSMDQIWRLGVYKDEEIFMKILNVLRTDMTYAGDFLEKSCWINSFEKEYNGYREHSGGNSVIFPTLVSNFREIVDYFGILKPTRSALSYRNRMRMLISREPALSSSIPVETIIKELSQAGVDASEDIEKGKAILIRMGFKTENAHKIVETFITEGKSSMMHMTSEGALTDDFLIHLNIVQSTWKECFFIPDRISRPELLDVLVDIGQEQIHDFLVYNKSKNLTAVYLPKLKGLNTGMQYALATIGLGWITKRGKGADKSYELQQRIESLYR
jgi:hypothetical protein